jgi:hypothetical protein
MHKLKQSWAQWLIPILLANQEAELWRIAVYSQPGKIVYKTPHLNQLKNKSSVQWYTPVIPVRWDHGAGRPRYKMRPYR